MCVSKKNNNWWKLLMLLSFVTHEWHIPPSMQHLPWASLISVYKNFLPVRKITRSNS